MTRCADPDTCGARHCVVCWRTHLEPHEPQTCVHCLGHTRDGERCTAEVADPDADVLLCTEHLARAAAMVQEAIRTRTPS